jgi:prepilin-type N-terminal cleavage/methylation domain-containing protein
MARHRGFSLIEVVVATGLVAVGVMIVLGLLTNLSRQSIEAGNRQTAVQIPEVVTVELRRLAVQLGVDGLASTIPVMAGGADEGLLLVAARDGTHLRIADAAAGRDQYFLVEVRRFAAGPLAFTSEMAALPLNIRVTWPYRPGASAGLSLPVVPPDDRQSFNFNVAVTR